MDIIKPINYLCTNVYSTYIVQFGLFLFVMVLYVVVKEFAFIDVSMF